MVVNTNNSPSNYTWIALIALVFIVGLLIFWRLYTNRIGANPLKNIPYVTTAGSLDDFIKTKPTLMNSEMSQKFGINFEKVSIPVSTRLDQPKLTLVPEMIVGGDIIYDPVIETSDRQFFLLRPQDWDKIFKIDSPDAALKYIDFLMVKIGKTSYDRSRKTVWEIGDYEKIGCKDNPTKESNNTLPEIKPVSSATVNDDGYRVEWVYNSYTIPAGYYKIEYQVSPDGNVSVKQKDTKPFWSCGQGIVF